MFEGRDDRQTEVIEVPDRPQGARELIQAYDMAIEALQAEPKHGKWIDFKNGWKCTTCEMWNDRMSDYCPYCGAKMDGGVK